MSESARFCLRDLPLGARLGLTATLVVIGLGFWASIQHIENSHAKNDGDADAISITDVVGHYHGVDVPSPLRAVLAGEVPAHPSIQLADDERSSLDAWLGGERLGEDFDSIDLGEMAPVEIFARSCAECHFGDAAATSGGGTGLEYWEDLKPLLSDKRITPVPFDVLVTSMHTHALTMGVIVIVLGLLACATRFGGGLRGLPLFLGGLGLLADVGGWLLTRQDPVFVWGILAGGGLYTVGCALAALLVVLELWLPRKRG